MSHRNIPQKAHRDMLRPLYTREISSVPTVEKGGWVSGTACTGMKKRKSLAPAGIQTPDRPARNKPLYLLSYYNYIAVL